jgi:uncharacterized delta-60 repeat protein
MSLDALPSGTCTRSPLFMWLAVMLTAPVAFPCFALDGQPDPTFGSAGVAYVTPDDVDAREIKPVVAIALPDGKLLFGGTRNRLVPGAPAFEPEIRAMLVRLNADGSPDGAFGNTSIPGLFDMGDLVFGTRMQGIESMVRLDSGAFIAVGNGMVNGPEQGFVIQFDASGNLDFSFGTEGVALFPKFYPHAVHVDSAGRVVVAGERFDSASFVYTGTVLRLTSTGAADATFGTDGEVPIPFSDPAESGYLHDLAIVADGDIVVGGAFEAYGSGLGSDFALARLDPSGAFDATFAGTGWRTFHDPSEASMINSADRLSVGTDGGIAFAGYHASGENLTGLILGRVASDGSSDATFGDLASPGFLKPAILPTAQNVNVSGLVVQPDGKLIVSAAYFSDPDKEGFFAVRATADGRIDPEFAAAGVYQADLAPDGVYSETSAMTLQSDGAIVLGGRARRSASAPVVDMAATRLLNANTATDVIFEDGFEAAATR